MKPSVLFVCWGNICRSPMAEGIMRHLLKAQNLENAVRVDSAGTIDFHAGEAPDSRGQATLAKHGIASQGRSRKLTAEDFSTFDYIIAMDQSNHKNILAMAPTAQAGEKVQMMRHYDSGAEPGAEVPDPYYGIDGGFDGVFDILWRSCQQLLTQLVATHDLEPGA